MYSSFIFLLSALTRYFMIIKPVMNPINAQIKQKRFGDSVKYGIIQF